LKHRGFENKLIATDMNFNDDHMKMISEKLPKARFVNINNLCLEMRVIKTSEEIALTQRAYRYFDKIHAFGRDYILET